MTVRRCHICRSNPAEERRYQGDGLADGKECPICYSPTCRFHLATVRWRWRDSGEVDSEQICRQCKRSYRHRAWDAHKRDWIS